VAKRITVDVSAHRDELPAVGELAENDVDAFLVTFEARQAELETMPSTLPDKPDFAAAEVFLIGFRIANLAAA